MLTSRTLLIPLLLILGTAAAQPNTWVNTGAGAPASQNALGFAIDGKVYTCLGIDQDGALLTDLWQYDPATQTWQEKAAFAGTARTGAVCFTVGNKAYIATGVAAGDTLNDLWEYDPLSDAWAQKADLPGSARMNASAFSIGGYGYVCTGTGPPVQDVNGYDMYPDLGDLWAYDPALDSWTQRTDLFTSLIYYDPPLRWNGLSLAGQGYAVRNGDGATRAYDPGSNTWIQKADLSADLWQSGYVVPTISYAVGGHGYLVNMGENSDTYDPYLTHPNRILEYDPVADAWAVSGYFTGLSRDNVAVASSGPIAYIMGGAHLYPWPDPDNGIPTGDYRLDLPEMWAYDVRDCQGTVDGPVVPGDACDDGNAGTFNDAYDLACTCTGSVQAQPPFHPDQLDATFTTGTGFDGEVLALCLQPDGKVIATGDFTHYNGAACNGIARLNPDGSLDAGFNGAVGGRALAVQPDGRILAGGNGITRLMPDGSADGSFDTDLSGIGQQPIHALAVRPDGAILAGGIYTTTDEWGNTSNIGLMQLMPDGSRDPSFLPDVVIPTANVLALQLRPNGNLLVGMDNVPGGGDEFAFNLLEFAPDGSRPYVFGNNIGFSFREAVRALVVQPDADLVAGGDFSIFDDDPHVFAGIPRQHLAVIDADGLLVGEFDPGVSTDGPVRALVCGPQGQVIAGGDFSHYRNETHGAIVQLNDYGYANPTFASGTGFNAAVNTMVMAPDGQLIVGGAFTAYNGTACGHITRLRTPGPLCLPTQLTTIPDPVISCGAVNLKFDGSSIISATEVPGANRYQFRFTNSTGQPAYSRNISFPSRSFTLTKWYTNPLKAGRTYNVVVRASFDNGATWCDYGPSCTVRISWSPFAPGMLRGVEEAQAPAPELLVYPNPTNGEQMRIHLGGADPALITATLDLVDLIGQRVLTATLPLRDGELDTVLPLRHDLAEGVYLLTITAGERVLNERVVITR